MTRVLPLAVLLTLALPVTSAESEPTKFFVQWIYATNSERPPGKGWVKIGAKLRRELSPVFQWKNYWQVSSTEVAVKPGSASKMRLTEERELEIAFQPDGRVGLALSRNKKMVRRLKNMSATERVVMGSDGTADDAWFVVVRPDKPSTD